MHGRTQRGGLSGATIVLAGLAAALAVVLAVVLANRSRDNQAPAPFAVPSSSIAPLRPDTPTPADTATSAPYQPATTAPSTATPPVAPGALGEAFREKLKNATVMVLLREVLQQGLGSGFFVSEDGLIATNHHVIASKLGAGRISVKLYGSEQELQDVLCVADDPQRDLALLRIRGIRPPSVLTLYQGAQVPETTPVVVVGHPRQELWSITQGTITGYREYEGQPFYGTDARIEPGNSGGPMTLRETGEVVGISDWKIMSTSMNYAIPVEALRDLIRSAGDRPGSPCR